jgi:hypothetical protein
MRRYWARARWCGKKTKPQKGLSLILNLVKR